MRDRKTPGRKARIAAILFADVVGFSKLTDPQVQCFVRGFLTVVGKFVAETEHQPIHRNTWGDCLYFQFGSVRAAGLFALALNDLVRNRDWTSKGLPRTLSLRSALHAGPVFPFRDPITGGQALWGRHITRAARTEPVTPVGEVYATWEFAALTAAQRIEEFTCEPVGLVSLAKAYGDAQLYHVRRRGTPERDTRRTVMSRRHKAGRRYGSKGKSRMA